MIRICLYCPNPLTRYGAKSHLICWKREVTRRAQANAGKEPTKSKKWRRWEAERAAAERAAKIIRKDKP